jgi:hypothetical protein
MIYITVLFIIVAVGMQVSSIRKSEHIHKKTSGIIRTGQDLLSVKEVINLNMKLAISYIAMFVLFIIILIIAYFSGTRLGHIILSLFLFGVITLVVGLLGKTYEKKIKSMEVKSDDPEILRIYEQYLVQWKEPRFQLRE